MSSPTPIAEIIRERLRAMGCAWCLGPLGAEDPATEVHMRLVHDSPCLDEFDTFTHSNLVEIPDSTETQLRNSVEHTIADDELVVWGEWVGREPDDRYSTELVRWGDLSCYERHTVERRADGKLVGGYPI